MPYYSSYTQLKRGMSYRMKKFSESESTAETVSFDNMPDQAPSSHSSTSSGSAAHVKEVTSIPPNTNNYGKTKSIFNFNRDNILYGIIFSEILGEPRSKKYMRKK